ncbi:YgiQ family radical SAM protein [Peptacetobacter hominis]|uniref:YgiQ family radical SAM protein n=1 Tax=Peptacetobacter hominis TaxID=2743610 RepID=A0A544QYI5_9FIRM|nr:YgiQ family radical SAM protein [Peptacetobacter hominis]TQQ85773.1 YgiQ family radical SAM protein [Peptacetobacter hominis]
MENKFLPISMDDMRERGWEEVDFAIVTGDAYVDHHSFGTAIISRVLENAGYKIGIIAQPDWKSDKDFMKFGRPRLGFLVNSGNMDSMVNHYSVSKRRRDHDLYSPGGKMGKRPDRAVIVYCNKIREIYGDIPVVIGGIEASLRRFSHYDYWNDRVRNSILVDSGADMLIYGMSEKQIVEVADAINDGFNPKYIRHVNGTCYIADALDEIYDDYILLPSHEEVASDKRKYAEAFKIQYEEQDPIRGKVLVQKHGDKYLVQNVPERPLTREELDAVYDLPYQKAYHPIYEKDGGIPAINEVKFSIVSNRGCFGSCSFCAITFHQGRIIQSRSKESIVREATEMTKMKDFKGYIHDVGGPTADFRQPACKKQLTHGACKNRQCLYPSPCRNLNADHSDYIDLLRAVRNINGVKKVFVRSGIRYDFVMAEKNDRFIKELIKHHVSGQLKVAPEHISERVLDYMQKPAGKTYDKFRKKFFEINEKMGLKQYLIPYLMSSHPGCELDDAVELAEFLRDTHYQPEQVQDFYPTPGTLSTAMFYTGLNPLDMKPVYIPKDRHEKAMQRALLQFSNPKNYDLVHEALERTNREDLIGYGPKCLIKPRKGDWSYDESRDRRNSASSSKKKSSGKRNNKSSDNKKKDNRKTGSKDNRNRGRNNTESKRNSKNGNSRKSGKRTKR